MYTEIVKFLLYKMYTNNSVIYLYIIVIDTKGDNKYGKNTFLAFGTPTTELHI